MNVISALKKIAQNFTRTSKMIPKRIGLIGFDGAGTIDMAGAAAAFTCAQIQEGDRGPRRCYEVIIVGLSNKPFTVMSGLIFQPHKTFKNAPPLDTLIIPGGLALIKPQVGRPVAAFVKARAGCTRRIVSFCSGIYGLAMTNIRNRCNFKRNQFRICLSWRHGCLAICMKIYQWRLWPPKRAFVPDTLLGGSR